MNERVILSGFGGQGILVMGNVLAHAAMEEGLEVTFFPSYGAEMRGGTANCSVIISDKKIGSPVVSEPDTLIAMNQPSIERFSSRVKKGGLIIVNSSLVTRPVLRKDVRVVKIEGSAIAERIGNVRTANMVVLGSYMRHRKIMPVKRAVDSLAVVFDRKRNLIDINTKALTEGAKEKC